MKYLLDANVFITASNLHYGLDFCPAFWDWLILWNDQGKVFSIEKVEDEISAGDDALAEWVRGLGQHLFLKPDTETLQSMREVGEWVSEKNYDAGAVNTFLQVADCWLVSHALAHEFTVVTHEKAAETLHKVKIPNVGVGLDIKVMTPFEMLRREKACFILGTKVWMPAGSI